MEIGLRGDRMIKNWYIYNPETNEKIQISWCNMWDIISCIREESINPHHHHNEMWNDTVKKILGINISRGDY